VPEIASLDVSDRAPDHQSTWEQPDTNARGDSDRPGTVREAGRPEDDAANQANRPDPVASQTVRPVGSANRLDLRV
jgi:hypothetical protein